MADMRRGKKERGGRQKRNANPLHLNFLSQTGENNREEGKKKRHSLRDWKKRKKIRAGTYLIPTSSFEFRRSNKREKRALRPRRPSLRYRRKWGGGKEQLTLPRQEREGGEKKEGKKGVSLSSRRTEGKKKRGRKSAVLWPCHPLNCVAARLEKREKGSEGRYPQKGGGGEKEKNRLTISATKKKRKKKGDSTTGLTSH